MRPSPSAAATISTAVPIDTPPSTPSPDLSLESLSSSSTVGLSPPPFVVSFPSLGLEIRGTPPYSLSEKVSRPSSLAVYTTVPRRADDCVLRVHTTIVGTMTQCVEKIMESSWSVLLTPRDEVRLEMAPDTVSEIDTLLHYLQSTGNYPSIGHDHVARLYAKWRHNCHKIQSVGSTTTESKDEKRTIKKKKKNKKKKKDSALPNDDGGRYAVFPLTCFVNHACAPNCIHVALSRGPNHAVFKLYAGRDIAAGTEITHTYLNGFASRDQRHRELAFECGCTVCNAGPGTTTKDHIVMSPQLFERLDCYHRDQCALPDVSLPMVVPLSLSSSLLDLCFFFSY